MPLSFFVLAFYMQFLSSKWYLKKIWMTTVTENKLIHKYVMENGRDYKTVSILFIAKRNTEILFQRLSRKNQSFLYSLIKNSSAKAHLSLSMIFIKRKFVNEKSNKIVFFPWMAAINNIKNSWNFHQRRRNTRKESTQNPENQNQIVKLYRVDFLFFTKS